MTSTNQDNIQLESGTYEIIRKRLEKQATDLQNRLQQLNLARKEVFGAIETQLIANDRINTQNYCTARDIVAIGNQCVFGYNVHVGLRSGIQLKDVFSIYEFDKNTFQAVGLKALEDEKFQTDFQNLYRYYKNAYFARFTQIGSYLYMVFHLNQETNDFKSFKWLITDQGLEYSDNRSDHEVVFPNQYEFKWQRASRDVHRKGTHPHVSILDRVFVETVGGDLTIKIEDNTNDGLGVYQEEVEYQDQTLDDAEYFYADLGNLIVLKIRPYQEDYRYFVYNEKMQEVKRIDTLGDAGVLLPDQHGLIFANGYYLQMGEYKIFDPNMRNKQFIKRITSPNGEDYLYVFYNIHKGTYVLMHYNVIEQKVNTPIICNGFTHFPNGELAYFKAEDEPTKHHVVQIWQTPFVANDVVQASDTESYLFKVGNKDIVKAMAECQEVLTLSNKQDTYTNLYDDLTKKCTDILDSYYWIDKEDAFQLNEPLLELKATANSAIEEYEKKVRIQKNTATEIKRVRTKAEDLFDTAKKNTFDAVDLFVQTLADLRVLRGEIISLKELRYTDLPLIEELETQAVEITDQLSNDCVNFLLEDNALEPYRLKIEAQSTDLNTVETATQANELGDNITQIGQELELLIDIVSNLKIDDATQTTRIIDNISGMYARINQVKAAVKKKLKDLTGTEATAEFNAQLKLLDQGIINYLDIADTPDKCDEYLSKLMIQLEELEGKFAEFDEFIPIITEKREEIYVAFEARKNSLLEARNNRTSALQNAADRILNGIQNRAKAIKEVIEINGFFASDLMIDKVRDIIAQLNELEDSNKANTIQTRLKTLKEEAIRQLRDQKELLVDGQNIIRFGRHQFAVNTQPLDLTIVNENGSMKYHLTGTNFYENIDDPRFLETQSVWNQQLLSENTDVYRSEFLAYQLFISNKKEQLEKANGNLLKLVQKAAATRYQEGYTKGIHDEDAARILEVLVMLSQKIDLLSFTPQTRAFAKLWWTQFLDDNSKKILHHQLKSAGVILQVFPDTHEFDYLLEDLQQGIASFVQQNEIFNDLDQRYLTHKMAQYLFRELSRGDVFIISTEAAELLEAFKKYITAKKAQKQYDNSVFELRDNPTEQYQLIRKWIHAFIDQTQVTHYLPFLDETTMLLFADDFNKKYVIQTKTSIQIENLHGTHPVLNDAVYNLDYNTFTRKMENYEQTVLPLFEQFTQLKKDLAAQFKKTLRLEEFKPRVLSSFVRNKLIDQVYLPIFGDNLAKQIGTAGENTRTDRMGMLLLISPPGYGKTTLMEYIASRLGLIFMKINGPALGHHVTSLDPADANNMAAKQELQKLNLALEMGNNVMLYLDDIQHCNPEFLQKFISLCDGQRKIEGVYKNESKTYDLRGKRIAVVMAGNPYTESGDKFQIPDMLANRADIYNLGDIIGDSESVFKMSYIENALTSNPVLQQLSNKSLKDVYGVLQLAENGNREGIEFEANHSPEELNEYVGVLKKMLRVRDVVLKVNQEYIRSAAMQDEYRTEPSFKLQGSYRNMNKLAEKIVPIMNEQELDRLILTHYEGESQTLTSGAEANFLKLKELLGILTEAEQTRWETIKTTFNKNKLFRSADGNNPMNQVIAQLSAFTDGIEGIKEVLEKGMGGK